MQIEPVEGIRCKLGEGPLWDVAEQALYLTDMIGNAIYRYRPDGGGIERFALPRLIGSLALREQGGAIVALADGFHLYDFRTGALDPIGDPEAHLAVTQWNDGKVDPRGRFLSGTVATDHQSRVCGLYSVDQGRIACLDGGFAITNGPCWSPTGETFYFADSIPHEIYAYDYDLDSGSISGRRLFADTRELGGIPDGATVDSEGRLWSAICGAGKIVCYAPTGAIERVIDVPPRYVSSVMFGGPDLDRLYCTSIDGASIGRDSDAAGGRLFVIEGLRATGLPEPRYRG